MLSVLMVVQRYFPAIGGVEKHVSSLIHILTEQNIRTGILTSSHEPNLSRTQISEGTRITRIPQGYDRCPPLVYLWLILNRHIFNSYDLVHIHDPFPLLAWYLPLRLLNIMTPTHITFHGYESDPVPSLMRVIRRIAKTLTDSSLCVGSFISKIYDISCTSSTLGAVEGGCATTETRSGALFVGRLECDIGIIEYIQAIKEVTIDGDFKLTICGGGSLKSHLQELAENIPLEIEFKGYVKNPQKFMGKAKVMLGGGFLSILEAMACGVPVIAIARSRLRWHYYKSVLSEGGLISIQTTPSGVASEIEKLMSDDDLWRRISEEGKRFAARWSWERLAELYLYNWKSR